MFQIHFNALQYQGSLQKLCVKCKPNVHASIKPGGRYKEVMLTKTLKSRFNNRVLNAETINLAVTEWKTSAALPDHIL